ncbi:MAG TPA: membrane protein insertase YidC [Cytophagaceae bacterium]|jgi:YidC/Oxa1 family membrane protein insertase
MDRNQVTGIILIMLLMLAYFSYFGNDKKTVNSGKNTTAVSTTVHTATPTTPQYSDSLQQLLNKEKFGNLASAAQGEDKEIVLENKDLKVFVSTKGGNVKRVLLKHYLTDDKKPLYVVDENSSKISLFANINARNTNLSELFFTPASSPSNGKQSVSLRLTLGPNQFIEQNYSLPESGYLVDYDLKFTNVDNIVSAEPIKINWKANLPKVEYDIEQSRLRSTINYYSVEGEFEYLNETSKDEESAKIDEPIKWISMKQKFFNSGLIAKNSFQKAFIKSDIVESDTVGIKSLEADIFIASADIKAGKGNFQYYFGPNDFKILKKVTEGYHKNVYLGWPVINWVNRFIVIPVFNFLQSFISNYGIIIIILVLLIKLLLFPLSYKSYVSMAKMKVMKPELDEIKAKYPDDMQKQQSEQMQLYQKVGINPLSGCIPVVLQMPILLAMFNFFPNSIELRQEPFLWASDLSTYDAPIMLPFTIPFYGSHVSIFTLLMTISTLVYTWFNNQMSTVTGPMKSVSYVMPVVFMFVLNSFPAGLSFYYFVSNIVTIAQQMVIRKFVDEGKIRVALEENKKKNASIPGGKKSAWMQRVEDAMKAREEQKKKK